MSGSEADGMVIYNTNASIVGGKGKGLYIFDAEWRSWKPISNPNYKTYFLALELDSYQLYTNGVTRTVTTSFTSVADGIDSASIQVQWEHHA